MQIRERVIGDGAPCFIIAEVSANHRGDFSVAEAIVRAAADAGADAIKLQTYTPDSLTIDSDDPRFALPESSAWAGWRLYELYTEAMTPWDWYGPLRDLAESLGMECFSSPFDHAAVDFLVDQGASAIKIASFELLDLPLIERAAGTGLPLIMSTGMANLGEIDRAAHTVRAAGASPFALLRCNSAYPSPADQMDLRSIPALIDAFGVPVGLSDHTMSSTASVVSVALGACIIERHLTDDRANGGPDGAFSAEPAEFAEMVRAVREAEAMLGEIRFGPSDSEQSGSTHRRSLFAVEAIAAGEAFTTANVRSIRPGDGLDPALVSLVTSRVAHRDIARGEPLSWDAVGGPAL